MGRLPITIYAVTIAALGGVLLYQLSRPPRTHQVNPPLGKDASRRLSAITVQAPSIAGKAERVLDTERLRNQRLQTQLDWLESTTDAPPTASEFVEVNREAFCRSNALNLRSVVDVDPASGSLPEALSLSDAELEQLRLIFSEFHTRLKSIERDAIRVVRVSADHPNQLSIRIPSRIEGRKEMFAAVQSELHDLLGLGRDGVAMAALRANDLVGTPNSIKEFNFTRTSDGMIKFTTGREEVTEYFPGTDQPYDGTPGIEPDVYSQRKLITSITLASDEVEMLFTGLVDLSTLEPPGSN